MRKIRTISALAWRVRLTLDGTDVELRLRWNARLSAWYATMLQSSTGRAIFAGVRVELGWPVALASRVPRGENGEVPAGPPGCLVALDTTRRGIDLDENGFDRGVSLLYFTADELAVYLQSQTSASQLARIERIV